MKIGVITKREKAHKAGSVMEETADILRSRGIAIESIYPEDSSLDVARIEADHDLYLLKSGTETALSLAGVLHASGAKIINPYPTVVAMRDKIISTKMLLSAGVPLPETWFASRPEQLAGLLNEGRIVVKPFWAASQGRGVQIIMTEEDLSTVTGADGVIFAQRYH